MSRLPVTVSWELHNAMTNACGGPFADSYLSGAIQGRGILATATETARLRLLGNREAMAVLTEFGLRLEGPSLLRERQAFRVLAGVEEAIVRDEQRRAA